MIFDIIDHNHFPFLTIIFKKEYVASCFLIPLGRGRKYLAGQVVFNGYSLRDSALSSPSIHAHIFITHTPTFPETSSVVLGLHKAKQKREGSLSWLVESHSKFRAKAEKIYGFLTHPSCYGLQ